MLPGLHFVDRLRGVALRVEFAKKRAEQCTSVCRACSRECNQRLAGQSRLQNREAHQTRARAPEQRQEWGLHLTWLCLLSW